MTTMLSTGCREAPEIEKEPPRKYRLLTREDLLSVSAPDNNNVWVLGFGNTILHSRDGGGEWVQQKSPAQQDLTTIYFADTKNGWAAGQLGNVIRTTDGGKNWTDITQAVNTENKLIDVFFLDPDVGWIVGVFGTILHTEDGGETWSHQGWDEDRIYNSVVFVDNQKGWIAAEYGTIYHTEDGGETWVQQECQDIVPVVEEGLEDWAPPMPSLYDVYFESAERGWIVGLDGVILLTEDGGATWKQLESTVELGLFSVAVPGENGCTVGIRGSYLFTRDGGMSWEADEFILPTKTYLRDIDFSDENHGWIVGGRGTIIRSGNGGKSWEMVSGMPISFH